LLFDLKAAPRAVAFHTRRHRMGVVLRRVKAHARFPTLESIAAKRSSFHPGCLRLTPLGYVRVPGREFRQFSGILSRGTSPQPRAIISSSVSIGSILVLRGSLATKLAPELLVVLPAPFAIAKLAALDVENVLLEVVLPRVESASERMLDARFVHHPSWTWFVVHFAFLSKAITGAVGRCWGLSGTSGSNSRLWRAMVARTRA
jgi:hypothetical protein